MRYENNRTPNVQRRPKRKNHAPRNVFLLAIILSVIAVSAYAVSSLRQEPPQAGDISGYANVATPSSEPLHTNYQSQSQEHLQLTQRTFTFNELAAMSNNHLLLVNMDYAVPEGTPGDLVRISNLVQTLNPTTMLREGALTGLRTMLDSAAAYEFVQFRVTQGFRTHEYQQNLYDTMGESGIAAPPGHSEHQVGLAVDISYHGVNIGNSPQGTWLMENSYRYGFILRYPQHKTDITGIPFEPWHYRYVGQPHAYFMFANDLVLEEYIGLLRRDGELTVVYRQVTYMVYYLSDGDTIEISEGYTFNASLDNTGGVVVTVWGLPR